ncbi:MAG: AbrB/MazE/SpoVT family DNA-binding domain-containing protein [Gammaproteobacteria bacterium]|nr:AbrB/MazE/SpoVT family DNA-binding domain-containing protein [Gammaproteobacteria bacterium]
MAKVTSKLQVTIPKRIADEYGIAPGDEVDFLPAGDAIRMQPARSASRSRLSVAERLRLFDAATNRQREREKTMTVSAQPSDTRDWTREELYSRGKPR